MTEAVLVPAALASSFHGELVADQLIEPQPAVTLRPRYGLKVALQRRRR